MNKTTELLQIATGEARKGQILNRCNKFNVEARVWIH
jgi:hypothetical protein